MSRFFTDRLSNLTPYTPGEQPKDTQYIKLNTNSVNIYKDTNRPINVLNNTEDTNYALDPNNTDIKYTATVMFEQYIED